MKNNTAVSQPSRWHNRQATPERPCTIALLGPLIGGYYHGDLVAGADAAARRHGARLIAMQTSIPWPEQPGQPGAAPFVPLAWDQVDGFVVVVDALTYADLQLLATSGKPLVTVSMPNPDPSGPSVLPDNHGGALAVVRHLISHGHRRIAFAGYLAQEDIRQRHEGYQAALAESGIEPDSSLCFPIGDNLESGGQQAAAALLTAGMPCTAIFLATDRNALAFMAAIQAAGYRVPEDLAVVGFDDIDLAQQAAPALTSVRQQYGAVAELAAEQLLANLAGTPIPPGPTFVPTTLICRHSCGCTGIKREAKLLAAEYSAPDWAVRLTSHLAHQLVAPIQPPLETPPEHLWPGVGVIVAALEAAVEGAVAPDATLLDQAWRQASARTRGAEVLDAILALLECAGLARHRLCQPDSMTTPGNLRAFLDMVRLQVLRSSMMDTLHMDAVQRTMGRLSRSFLKRSGRAATDLSWLRLVAARRACLGLWEDESAGPAQRLRITACYSAEDGAVEGSGALVYPQAFPPADFLVACIDQTALPAVQLLPLGTPERDWGVLAVVGPAEQQFHEAHDAIRHGTAELTLALEHEALLQTMERQQEQLRESEQRFRDLVEGAPVGICLIDTEARFTDVNDAFAAFLGYTRDELHGRPIRSVFVNGRHDGALIAFETHSATGAQMTGEAVLRGKGGLRTALGTSIRLHGHGDRALRALFVVDITERKRLEHALTHVAQHDALTDLPNRTLFNDRLVQALPAAGAACPLALLLIDLDRFKEVNDTLGHQAGDQLLCVVAKRIGATLRPEHTVARLGGDEFALLLPRTDRLGALRVADRLRAVIEAPIQVLGQMVSVTLSVGVALAPLHAGDAVALLRCADVAMYRAKRAGGGAAVYQNASR